MYELFERVPCQNVETLRSSKHGRLTVSLQFKVRDYKHGRLTVRDYKHGRLTVRDYKRWLENNFVLCIALGFMNPSVKIRYIINKDLNEDQWVRVNSFL